MRHDRYIIYEMRARKFAEVTARVANLTTINLACTAGHTFEGWFRSAADFEKQRRSRLVSCPWCGDDKIERRLSVPNVICRSRGKATRSLAAAAAELKRLHAFVEKNCEYVGDRFAEEARSRHEEHLVASSDGGASADNRGVDNKGVDKGIYGKASVAEVRALHDEGIAVAPLPPLPSSYN